MQPVRLSRDSSRIAVPADSRQIQLDLLHLLVHFHDRLRRIQKVAVSHTI